MARARNPPKKSLLNFGFSVMYSNSSMSSTVVSPLSVLDWNRSSRSNRSNSLPSLSFSMESFKLSSSTERDIFFNTLCQKRVGVMSVNP